MTTFLMDMLSKDSKKIDCGYVEGRRGPTNMDFSVCGNLTNMNSQSNAMGIPMGVKAIKDPIDIGISKRFWHTLL